MTTWNLRGTYVVQSLLVIALGLFLPLKPTEALASEKEDHESKYLFICAGDQARTAPDFLAVINFDEDSKDYGQGHRLSAVPSTRRGSGNEPHHIGLSENGRVVACGAC